MKKSLYACLALAALCAGAAFAAGPPLGVAPALERAQVRADAHAQPAVVAAPALRADLDAAFMASMAVGRSELAVAAPPPAAPHVRIWPNWAVYVLAPPAAPPHPYPRT